MSIISSSAALIQARRDLFIHWQAVEPLWKDERARNFNRDYLEPVDPALRRACDGIAEMSSLLERAMRECE